MLLFEESNTKLDICFTLVPCLDYSSTLKMEQHVPSKRRLTSNGLYDVISSEI
jgi:hypothetical protein